MPPKRGRGGRYGGGGARKGAPANVSSQAMDDFLSEAMSGFSMRDEARNTTRDHLKWDRDERLRYRPITFVSAGFIEPLKEFQIQPPVAKPEEPVPSDGPDSVLEQPEVPAVSHEVTTASLSVPFDTQPPASDASNAAFFVDTSGDKSLCQETPAPVLITDRSAHAHGEDSDSSEEVILYKGRASAAKATASRRVTIQHSRRELDMVGRRLEVRTKAVVEESVLETSRSQPKLPPHQDPKPLTPLSVTIDRPKAAAQSNHPEEVEKHKIDSDDAPVLGDGDDSDALLSDYIKNMDGMEELLAHHQQFARRELGGGHDEVLSEGPAASNSSAGADSDDEPPLDDPLATGDPSAAVSEADEWPVDVDDAELARLLAKQEALGLGGDKLLLFDEAIAPNRRRSRRKPFQAKHAQKSPPDSASGVAQIFDDLDLLMDWDRTNPPRRKSKAKLGEVKFNVSDDELRAAMEASYGTDRLKKAERKKEREVLRAKGMLGKNADPDDTRVKYPDGINIAELEEELRTFLMGPDPSLTLPPMDSSARKIIHEVANRLKMKSKSTGSGDQRRPVLHRTKNTARYNEELVHQVLARIHRKSFPRLDKQRRSGTGGGSGYAALRYKDGEVVGGSAPELGETNKGRTMLEKMGWTKGTGLGAVDNKGILEPVAHVVKISKAGLG